MQDNQTEASLDVNGDTDPATDNEETNATLGAKRKAGESAGSVSKYVPSCLYDASFSNSAPPG